MRKNINYDELEDRITKQLCVNGKVYTCDECRYKNIPLICKGIRKTYKRVAKKIINSLEDKLV